MPTKRAMVITGGARAGQEESSARGGGGTTISESRESECHQDVAQTLCCCVAWQHGRRDGGQISMPNSLVSNFNYDSGRTVQGRHATASRQGQLSYDL